MTETFRLTRLAVGVALAAAALAGPAAADYPERPIRVIVPFAPGGPTDVMARVVAGPLGDALGQSVVIENRPGAGSNIGTGAVANAEPDGYTLLITSSAFVVNPSLYPDVPFDPLTDFAPIAMLGASPNIITANPDTGIDSLETLIARARAEPGSLNYASPGAGTTPHLAGELLNLAAGIDIVHVPFGGAGPAIQAILAGTTEVASTALPPAHAHVVGGSLIPLGITGTERWHDLPDVPTMIEQGFEGFVSETFQAFLAPAGTPQAIIDRLATEMLAVLARDDIRERVQAAGFRVIAEGPEPMRAQIEREVASWAHVISEAGITLD